MAVNLFLCALCALRVLCVIPSAHAQDNYEIQVYAYDTVEPGHAMVELHSNFTFEGSKTSQDGILPTNHQLHETSTQIISSLGFGLLVYGSDRIPVLYPISVGLLIHEVEDTEFQPTTASRFLESLRN
jgi:hypothetical protein